MKSNFVCLAVPIAIGTITIGTAVGGKLADESTTNDKQKE